jgi:hypothetical protein
VIAGNRSSPSIDNFDSECPTFCAAGHFDVKSVPGVAGINIDRLNLFPLIRTAPCAEVRCFRMRARRGFLTHSVAVHFERRAAAAEIHAVAEELLTAERKPDTHRVLKRPDEASGVVLTVTVSPHRWIEHRG